jgi:hypothetical protein
VLPFHDSAMVAAMLNHFHVLVHPRGRAVTDRSFYVDAYVNVFRGRFGSVDWIFPMLLAPKHLETKKSKNFWARAACQTCVCSMRSMRSMRAGLLSVVCSTP